MQIRSIIISMNENIKKLQAIIDESDNIVFFGGAGVSTESGIPDFRSVDGLYNKEWDYPPEEILSRDFFFRDTAEFYRFYRAKLLPKGIKPNKAHLKLAELEAAGKLKAVVTQNIDNLHQEAGSKVVYQLHGTTSRNYCLQCHEFYDDKFIVETGEKGEKIPYCKKCGGIVKPDVVLYQEGLDDKTVEGAVQAIANADTLIIGGTSLNVYPAASFIRYFQGKHLVMINKSVTPQDAYCELVIHEPIGEVLGQITVSA